MADSEFLYTLRNDVVVRQNSFHKEEVARQDHEVWLRHVLADERRSLFIAENEETGEPVGQLRLDHEDDRGYEISYSVAPAWRGQHVGTMMIGVLMRMLAASDGKVRIFAQVLPENFASQRVFLHNGFALIRQTDERMEYERYVNETT